MEIVILIATGILAGMFAIAGITKLATPKDKLFENGMTYVEDFSNQTIKVIGGLEVLAAIGLILPGITGVAPILVPIAAVCALLTMIGAVAAHLRRGEKMVAMPVALGVMAASVAIMRFRPYPL